MFVNLISFRLLPLHILTQSLRAINGKAGIVGSVSKFWAPMVAQQSATDYTVMRRQKVNDLLHKLINDKKSE